MPYIFSGCLFLFVGPLDAGILKFWHQARILCGMFGPERILRSGARNLGRQTGKVLFKVVVFNCWSGLVLEPSLKIADFNLSVGCFGTDIIQKCTKWSQIGVHGLKIWPIFAKFQCASFLIRKNVEKWQYGRKKTQKCSFSWKKIFEKLHGPYQSWKKQIFRYNLLKLN